MVFHIAVCSPDAALRSGLERQCMEYFARRQDACIVQQLPDADALLRRDAEGERFDLIFLDPPYRMEGANEMLSALCAGKICGPETLVIYEHARALPPDTAGWETLDRRDYRDTVITFLRKEAHGDADGVVSGLV